MRTLAAAVVLGSLIAAPAHAQPDVCGVTFVRAPDDVRHEIERWLEGESRCTSSLELRVVPTADGIYLWAQRSDGRIYERVVPDAQTAGVLVASWAADGWVEDDRPVAAPIVAVAPAAATPAVNAAPADDGPADAGPSTASWNGGGRWLTLGAAKGSGDSFGYRAALDVLSYGAWRFGVAAEYGSANTVRTLSPYQRYPGETMEFTGVRDTELVATISRGVTWGGWELGASLGAGVIYSSGRMEETFITQHDVAATAEGSVILTRHLTHAIAIGFGPLAKLVDERFPGAPQIPATVRREAIVQWNAAIRFAL